MSVQEDLDTIQEWKQANRFTITSRGHWTGIPSPSNVVSLSDYDPYASDNVAPQIREIASDGNYNTIYDSFYAPVDFQMSGIAFKLPESLPAGISYRIIISVNGSEIEKLDVPEEEDHNQKNMSIVCSSLIFEDDYIEIKIEFRGNKDLLIFNNHNAVFSVGGCMWYGMYKAIYSDISVQLATTENIELYGIQNIDGITVNVDDLVLVKNQIDEDENGIYVVSEEGWSRHPSYPTLLSLNGVKIFVEYGETQNSNDNTILSVSGGSFDIPLIEWTEGDKWFKTNLQLSNRSGNETITDRVTIDSVKSTHNFLLQGITVSMFDDPLMSVKPLKSSRSCIYVDVLVNGKSILEYVGFERPIPIDNSSNKFKEYDMEVFDNNEGYPIKFGDTVSVKVYQRNPYAKSNGKIISVIIYGCSPDCATIDSPLVSIYQPCDDAPCEWKFKIKDRCDPFAAIQQKNNPTVRTITPSLQKEKDYVTSGGLYVTINGQRIWI